MLRMEFYEFPDCMKLRMEGRFVQDFAEHARTLIGDSPLPSKLIVDLSDVDYVDVTGEEVLLWFKNIGVTFTAESAYSHHVCERLQLPVESQLATSSHAGHPRAHGHARRSRPSGEPSNTIFQGETHV